MKDGFISIFDKETYEVFDTAVQGFHDSLLREATLLSRGYVDRDGLMHGDTDPYDMKLVFHVQSSLSLYVELFFEEVDVFRFEYGYCIEPSIEFLGDCVQLYLTDQISTENCMISAKSMYYRIGTSDHLGN